MVQVVEINAIEHLESIRLRWTSLVYETPGASFFHTLDWLQVYWRHASEAERLRVLLVHHGGTIVGILPLVLRQQATATCATNTLTYPRINRTQFFGPVGPNPTATLMASLRHLAADLRDWGVLRLSSFGEHDNGRTANTMKLAELQPETDLDGTLAKICFDASWPKYLAQLEPGFAESIQEMECRAAMLGDLRFDRVRPVGNSYDEDALLLETIDQCVALLEATPSNAALVPSVNFFRDMVTTANRLGMLDLSLMRLNDQLLAFSFNIHFDGELHQVLTGESARFLEFDQGSLLTLWMLEDSTARQDRHIYLNGTDEVLAKCSAAQQVPVVRYRHRATQPLAARLLRFGQWLKSGVWSDAMIDAHP